MSKLVKWQFFSMISRFAAMAIGIAQSIFIVRFLSTADYGLVGLVTSVGSVVGIILHLGLVSGTTKEIAAAKSREEQFKIFVTAFLVRFVIALFLSLGLFVASPFIARSVYSHPEISPALRIFAVALLVQSVQGIFDAVLSGLKKFKQVFIYQAVIALVSFTLYVPLVYKFGFYGYFYALLSLAVISSIALFVLAMQSFDFSNEVAKFTSRPEEAGTPYSKSTRQASPATTKRRNVVARPWRAGFLDGLKSLSKYAAKLFSVGLAIYFVKILFTLWQKFGPLALGKSVSAAELGIFNFGLFYATKLMTASDAVTAVNLPVFSESFVDGLEDFKREFRNNFEKLYVFITFAAAGAIFWAPELFRLVAGDKYIVAVPLVPWLVLAFWCYSFVNIINSSIMIPAKMNKDMIISYLLLLLSTVAGYLFFCRGVVLQLLFQHPTPLYAMALAMSLGGLFALLWQIFAVRRRLQLNLLNRKEFLLTFPLLGLIPFHGSFSGIFPKLTLFTAVTLFFAFLIDQLSVLRWKNVWNHGLSRVQRFFK